jgi:hypothetical protein
VRALISTWDKSGLDSFARGLAGLGWHLVASGKTASALEAIGLPVEHVEAVTEFPEMLGGRVKTLHPRVHAGILARRDEAEDMDTLSEHGIEPIDLVCVNLYPFEAFTARKGVNEAEAVEMIDIGGPSMLRGAARSCARRASSHSTADAPSLHRPSPIRRPTKPRSRLGSTSATSSPIASSSRSTRSSISRTARTHINAPRTTRSAAHGVISSRASSNCTGRTCPSTTSTTSRPPARSRANSPCRPA